MGRPKSLIVSMELTRAGRAHNCRHNKRHRIAMGEQRLTIHQDGDDLHYCIPCAKLFLASDLKRLEAILLEADKQPDQSQ